MCAQHGIAETCISSDARFYWLAQGDPRNQCCGGNACSAGDGTVRGTLGRNAEAIRNSPEQLSTCLALIEIVNSCNLACPTCYADSPTGKLDAVPLADLQQRIQGVIDRKGRIEILQLLRWRTNASSAVLRIARLAARETPGSTTCC
jgi:hypothetical protein